jgi:preprotein translocase subunit SecB
MKKSEKHIEFEYLVLPLMRWLRENHNPHMTVVVDSNHAECLEGLYNVVLPVED